MEWNIGNIKIKNKVVLAPMAGISNPSFMKITEEMGVGLAFTELISAEAIVRGNKKTFDMLNGIENIKTPVGIQLFGSSPEVLARAAKIISEKYSAYPLLFVDINMGCPVPKIALRSQAGSTLLKDPSKIEKIVESVVNSVPIPVTVKIRSGWDGDHINAVLVAKICEKAGAKAITVHPRTRAQGYSGKADWDIIKQVKEAVSIPVIGNGDVKSCYDCKAMLDETGCDAVMIGRALMGNPWLIKECVDFLEQGILPKEVSLEEKVLMIRKHFNYLLEDKNEKVALLQMRSHVAWYLKTMKEFNQLKQRLMQVKTKEEFEELLNECK